MDWARDAHGKNDAMSYDEFADGVFQLVDIWTETCEVGEYVELLRRIIAGMTKPKFALLGGVDADDGADGLPTLVWKKDSEIEYDPFFDDARDEADADGDDDRALDLLQDELRNESGLAFELDRPMTAAPPASPAATPTRAPTTAS